MDQRYNGWANYETWCVALWIDNEQGSYHDRCERTKCAWERAEPSKHFTKSEQARIDLADNIKEWVHDMSPDLGASVFSDLLSSALGSVDWFEIADNWLTECDGYEAA